MDLRRGAALLVLALTLLCGASAGAQAQRCDLGCWQEELRAYVAAPDRNRRSLLALEKSGTDGLPAIALLALADAHLREGQLRAADRLFVRVIAQNEGGPWSSWARSGRAWTALQRGAIDDARAAVEDALAGDSTDATPSFLLGILEASHGDRQAGIRILSALTTDPEAPRDLRLAAEMGLGLAYYWAGHNDLALEAFRHLAGRPEAGSIADEARFAAARVQLARGEVSSARDALTRLASEPGVAAGEERVSTAMLNLDPKALRKASARIHRSAPLGAPSQMTLGMFDWNGHALARGLLVLLREDGDRDAAAELVAPAAAEPSFTSSIIAAAPAKNAAPNTIESSSRPSRHDLVTEDALPWRSLLLGMLLIVAAGVGAVRRSRTQPTSGRRTR